MGAERNEGAELDFKRLFEACPHPYLVVLPDPAFTIVAVDDRYLAATGACRLDVIGRSLFEVFPDNADDPAANGVHDLQISLDRVLRTGLQHVMGVRKYDVRREGPRGDADMTYWSPVNTPVFGADGAVDMIIHHVEDITEFVRTRARIAAATAQRDSRWERETEDGRWRDLARTKTARLAGFFTKYGMVRNPWARYAAAIAILALALALRLAILPVEAGMVFLTFYPAMAIIAFLCGLGPSLLAVLGALGVAQFVFIPPFWALKAALDQLPFLATFAVSGSMICAIIHHMRRTTGRLHDVNAQLKATMAALKRDSAERQRTERALRNSEERFRSSFEDAGIGMALVLPNRRWLQVNAAFCALVGYTEEELLQLTFQDITHPDDLAGDLTLVDELLAGKYATFKMEKRYIAKGGAVIWVLLSVSLLRDESGKPLYFISQVQDINERKVAQALLEQRVAERTVELAALVEHHRSTAAALFRMSQVVAQSPAMIYVTDLTGRIVYVNPEFERGTGWCAADAIGRDPRILKSPRTPPEVHRDMWKVITKGQVWRGQLEDFRRDGRSFWANVIISPLRDANGVVTHYVATHDDITDRREAELRVREAVRQAEAASRAKTELLANMSHELRTPLNAIIGYSEALLQGIFGTLANPRQEEYVGDILYSGQHLLAVINDILDVSAIEAGKLALHEEPTDMAALIEGAIRFVLPRATEGGIRIENVSTVMPTALVDARRMKQILLNLLSNAVKFTLRDGWVRLSSRLKDGGFEILVADSGIGMDEQGIAKSLEAFGQVETSLSRK